MASCWRCSAVDRRHREWLASPFLTRLIVAYEPSADVARDKLDLMLPMVLVFVPQLVCYGLATVTERRAERTRPLRGRCAGARR